MTEIRSCLCKLLLSEPIRDGFPTLLIAPGEYNSKIKGGDYVEVDIALKL